MNNITSNYILGLRRIAYNNLSSKIDTCGDFIDYACKWWLKKYKMPKTDKRFLDMSIEDIIIEYFEDQFDNNPNLLKIYEAGFNSEEEFEKEQLKKLMGDDYKEDVDYLVKPTSKEMNDIKTNKEEIIDDFSVLGK